MDRGRAFAPPPQYGGTGRQEWRDHGPSRTPGRGYGDGRRGGHFEGRVETGMRGGGHFQGRREGGVRDSGHYEERRESDNFDNRREGGNFYPRSEGGHSYGRREGGSWGGGHSDGRRESHRFGDKDEVCHFERREAENSGSGRNGGRNGGHFDARNEGGHFNGRREGGQHDGRRGGGRFDGKRGGYFDGRKEGDHYDGKADNEERYCGLSSGRGKGEGEFVKSRVWGKSRKHEVPREGWGVSVRLNNIPEGVKIGRLRSILREKGVHEEFDIKHIREGSGLVSFVEDSETVVEKLREIKIDDSLLQVEVVHDESDKSSGETKAKPSVESSVPDEKKFSTNSNEEKPSLDTLKEGPDSDKKKLGPVSSRKKRKPDSKKKKSNPDSNQVNFSPGSSKCPLNVKTAGSEAVFKEALGLFLPESYEISNGKLMLVYSLEKEILEDFREKLDKVLEIGDVDVPNDPIVCSRDQFESAKDEKRKVTGENSQENLTIVATGAGEIADKTASDEQRDGKEVSVEEALQEEVEEKGEEVISEKVESEPLQQVEAVFACMDVREKQKVIDQAKQKSLGDFLTTAKPKQGQIKKKKKRKPVDAEQD